MTVAIVGTGYVGLVTAACFVKTGQRVVCIDTDPLRVATVARGETPVHEEGLATLVRDGVARGQLSATSDLAAGVEQANVIFIAVGTPSHQGRIDLSFVEAAARKVGAALRGRTDFPVVVIKSTVVPGTTDTLVRQILESESGQRVGSGFGLAMNPEFLSQGTAVRDFLEADRIVIGANDPRSASVVSGLYDTFPAPLLTMTLREAEMVKYAANGLQATLISYANQIAALCEATPHLDHRHVLEAVHLDRMLGGSHVGACRFLMGGIGFGGSCFPKDLEALASYGRQLGVPMPLIEAVSSINAARPAQVLELLIIALGGIFQKRIAVLGLAFKPGTDDLRESPALKLIAHLQAHGAEIQAHDPLPLARERARAAGLPVVDEMEDAVRGADGVVVATAWAEYRTADWARLGRCLRTPVVLDGRGVLLGVEVPEWLRVIRVGTREA